MSLTSLAQQLNRKGPVVRQVLAGRLQAHALVDLRTPLFARTAIQVIFVIASMAVFIAGLR
jgi:hypothetical protein